MSLFIYNKKFNKSKKKNGDEQSPLFILRVVKCKEMTRYPDKPPVEIPLESFINK